MPQFEGISPYSVVTVGSEDDSVAYAINGEIIPQEAGVTTIVVTADGVSFTQEVTVVSHNTLPACALAGCKQHRAPIPLSAPHKIPCLHQP